MRLPIEEARIASEIAEELQLYFPSEGSHGRKGLEAAYKELNDYWNRYGKHFQRDPDLRKHTAEVKKALKMLVNALASVKRAEESLY